MPGLRDFSTETFSPRVIVVKAANYTATLADEQINVNGAYTITLPVISTMQGTTSHRKSFAFYNAHASAVATITAGTGNTIMGGKSSIYLAPGQTVVVVASEQETDWSVDSPIPIVAGKYLSMGANYGVKAVHCTGSTATTVFTGGAPVGLNITGMEVISQDTVATTLTLAIAGTSLAVATTASTAGAVIGAIQAASDSTAVTAGQAVTITPGASKDAICKVYFETPN